MRASPCGRIAFELFSGSGRFSSSWRAHERLGSVPIIPVDVKIHTSHDLNLDSNQRFIRGLIMANKVSALWVGTPCSSWSLARAGGSGPPPLRGPQHVMGLPNLTPKDQWRVHVANRLMRFTASLLRVSHRMHIPICMENPHSSRIWKAAAVREAERLPSTRSCTTDFCMWGTRWRKRTRLLACYLDVSRLAGQCPSVDGRCVRTGLKHQHLRGYGSRGFRTAAAEAYPASFCQAAVEMYSYGIHGKFHRALMRFID